MSKRKSKSKAMPWFRTWFEDWESDEVRSLDYAAYGFLFDLRMRMIQRGGPYPEDFLSHIARERSIARKTVEKMLTKLVALGLIIRADGNIWCEDLADEIEFREDKSEKLSDRNRKTSQKRWQKNQQNQSNGMPEEDRDKEEYGRPHKGGVQDQAVEKNLDSMGSVSADADRPLSGGEEPPSFDGEVEEQPDWLSQIPMPNSLDDYLDNGIADDPSVAGQKSTTSADAFDDDADAPEIDDAELDADQLAAWQSLDAVWDDDAGKKIYEGAEN